MTVRNRHGSVWKKVVASSLLLFLVAATGVLFLDAYRAAPASNPEARTEKRYIVDNAKRETGAENLVTSIYLGYRAFDTLGETIVLLMAVAGVVRLASAGSGVRKKP